MNEKSDRLETHIQPVKLYLGIAVALLILTITTAVVAQIPLGPYNLVVAIAIATTKALLVALFFMHLFYDSKFYLVIFSMAIIFLGLFIILTMFDTMRRGDIYPAVAKPIQEESYIYLKSDTLSTHTDTTSQSQSHEH
jgi:cytochrome c oxidase subunit 4